MLVQPPGSIKPIMSDKQNWFVDWFNSPYYHLLYFEHNEAEAAAFIRHLLDYFHPPKDSRMLDIACGRGRHARMLSEAGFEVVGFDLAPDSIAYATRFESETLHFYVHDMRLPFWLNYFDFAFNFFSSFGYFHTMREHANSIRTMSSSLRKKGILTIDFLNVRYAEERLIHRSEKTIGSAHFDITKWTDNTHFFKKIRVSDQGLETPFEVTEIVAKFDLPAFKAMLSKQGMRLTEVFGDYALHPFDEKESPRLILMAERSG
jgi:SAM-dependent methyltransferase